MRYIFATAIGGIVSAGIFAMPASASYMQKCSKLISNWSACQETGGACVEEQKAIEAQCKCHVQKGNDWKLVNAAVEKNDVCGSVPDDIILPPPPSPERPIIHVPPPPHGGPDKGDPAVEKDQDAGRSN